jgi:hypothetical protein
MTRRKTNLTDDELGERDERVRGELLAIIHYKRGFVDELQRMIKELQADARAIEKAAKAERWSDLEEYLDGDDIESLSNVSPTDLLGEVA